MREARLKRTYLNLVLKGQGCSRVCKQSKRFRGARGPYWPKEVLEAEARQAQRPGHWGHMAVWGGGTEVWGLLGQPGGGLLTVGSSVAPTSLFYTQKPGNLPEGQI